MNLAENPALEDYSLRYAPSAFRSWSPWMIFLSCLVRSETLSATVSAATEEVG
jgi:hypothetical protein